MTRFSLIADRFKTSITPQRSARRWRITALALMVPLLAACGAMGGPGAEVPTERFYRLDIAPPATSGGPILFPGVLEVVPFKASGVLSERPIVYQEGPREGLKRYSYHFWVEPLPNHLQTEFSDRLREQGLFSRVVTPDLRIRADHTLLGRVVRFDHVVHSKAEAPPAGSPAASVDVELELVLVNESTGRITLQKLYREIRPLSDWSIDAAVVGMRDATTHIFDRFLGDIRLIL